MKEDISTAYRTWTGENHWLEWSERGTIGQTLTDHTASSRELTTTHWYTATSVLLTVFYYLSTSDAPWGQDLCYRESLSCTTIDTSGWNGLVDKETGVQIESRRYFLTNITLTCSHMIASFILNTMLGNATFRSALLNTRSLGLRCLSVMDDLSCYELWIILTETGTSMKYWRLKSILSFKVFMQDNVRPYVVRIPQDLFSAAPSVACLFSGYVAYIWDSTGQRLTSDSHLISSTDGHAYKHYGMLFLKQIFKIWLHATS